MKVCISILLLFLSKLALTQSSKTTELRELFVTAHTEEETCIKLFKLTENTDLKENSLAYAYHAVSNMLLANYALNPFKKWHYFKVGKEMLENVIIQNPKNIEIRFLRYCIQMNSPVFLAYQSDLETDKKIISSSIYNQPKHLQSFINPIFNNL
ncbi:MAG: hypothetical protein ACON4E_08115 [Flavobacteriales bacterium]